MNESEKLEVAIQGLRDIVDPLAKVQREMKADERLDGHGAVMYLQSPETYKRIARDTLKKLRRQP